MLAIIFKYVVKISVYLLMLHTLKLSAMRNENIQIMDYLFFRT